MPPSSHAIFRLITNTLFINKIKVILDVYSTLCGEFILFSIKSSYVKMCKQDTRLELKIEKLNITEVADD